MSLAVLYSRALAGMDAPLVTVEAHLANGLPSFTLVGLADVEVKEARERVRSAIQNSGLEFPSNKRITVNLAPADLPKDSGRFDLPIALGILAASGQIESARLAGWEFAGELSLSGELRPVRGALAMSLALHAHRVITRLVLPGGSAEEAALVPDAQVYRARHLLDVVRQFVATSPEADGGDEAVVACGRACRPRASTSGDSKRSCVICRNPPRRTRFPTCGSNRRGNCCSTERRSPPAGNWMTSPRGSTVGLPANARTRCCAPCVIRSTAACNPTGCTCRLTTRARRWWSCCWPNPPGRCANHVGRPYPPPGCRRLVRRAAP